MKLDAKETIWIAQVLMEAGLNSNQDVVLRSDNQSAINWATGERFPSGRVWRSSLITFPRTSLLLKFTLNPPMVIEHARAAHPTPNSRVKCHLVKLVPR